MLQNNWLAKVQQKNGMCKIIVNLEQKGLEM